MKKILGLLLSINVWAQTAQIVWKDSPPETVQLQPCGGDALCLSINNPGLPDSWGSAWTPQPKFFSSVTATVPGYTLVTADVQGVTKDAQGNYLLATASQFKYNHNRYGVISSPVYSACSTHHFLDGGDTLYFRFTKDTDSMEQAMILATPMSAYAKALALADLDEARIAQYPFLAKIWSLYTTDSTTFAAANPNGSTLVSWLLVPEHFFTRWGGAANVANIGPLAAMKHWYGLGTKASTEGFSNEHYGHAAWFITEALRLAPTDMQKALVTLNTGLYLLRYKIAYGLIDSAGPCFDCGMWRNEKSDLNSGRGTTGMRPSPAKSFDLDLVLAHTLVPQDPLIDRAFQVRSNYLLAAGPQWSGGGGARNLGRHLANLHHFYKATGNAAFKVKAEAEITHAFTTAINGMTRLWFREYTADAPSFSEGLVALVYVMTWVIQEGVRPDLIPHLKAMLAWHLQFGGQWIGTDKWRPAYFASACTNATGCTLTFNSNIGGMFWTELKKFAEPSQIAQFNAIEKQVYNAYAVSTFDADYGGLGPSHEKWLPMFAESARR